MTTALPDMLSAKAAQKRVTGKPNAAAPVLLANTQRSPMELEKPPIVANSVKRGRRQMSYKSPPEMSLSIDDIYAQEIMVDNVRSPQHDEAYTTVRIPADIGKTGNASLCVKVDTGAGGNVLPLRVFKEIYPNRISPAGLPTGLDQCNTTLTAYNGSRIPMYGRLRGPITWRPDSSGACPRKIISHWYVADTPGPAILGLLACERLKVVKMNCSVKAVNPGVQTLKPGPAPTAAKAHLYQ